MGDWAQDTQSATSAATIVAPINLLTVDTSIAKRSARAAALRRRHHANRLGRTTRMGPWSNGVLMGAPDTVEA